MASQQQQILFAETIAAMKKAIKRKAYDSDSDSEVERNTNRGQKLKKRARFVHQGQLAPPSGPEVYKEVVEHAGFQRAIISRNPPLVDEDGYEVDSEDDDEHIQEAVASAAELNPYADIHLEEVLAPLTAVIDLPRHPTLSRPFTSHALTELSLQGRRLLHKENQALWKVRTLLTKLCGDHTWVPCSMMEEPHDLELFSDDFAARPLGSLQNSSSRADSAATSSPPINGDESASRRQQPVPNGHADRRAGGANTSNKGNQTPQDVSMAETETSNATEEKQQADGADQHHGAENPSPQAEANQEGSQDRKRPGPDEGEAKVSKPRDDSVMDGGHPGETPVVTDGATKVESGLRMGGQDRRTEVGTTPTADQAGPAASSAAMSVMSDGISELAIHPLFLAPKSAHPERDLGLPEQEAEDVRRLLQLYVQKQEEVCRGALKLYRGLLRADTLRKTVLQWSKAEAHCGPNRDMSDGEDWYDKEELGVTEELKKGQDEEEEETNVQTTKKTRNRK